MKKRLIRFISGESLTFAIKREILNGGAEKLTPVVKEKGLFRQWTPIVKIDNKFEALNYESNYPFTEAECKTYIEGYRQQLNQEKANMVTKITFEAI